MTANSNLEDLLQQITPPAQYNALEAKFCASLYWLVFRATEDRNYDGIPPEITNPFQASDNQNSVVRSAVIDYLTHGEIYCLVCEQMYPERAPLNGHWAIIQCLSRDGFYVMEEGDVAVTDAALQENMPFRLSSHLALMDSMMAAYSAKMISIETVVKAVRQFSSFNASRELPFDLEDAILLWINKVSSSLNDTQTKKDREQKAQMLQNKDQAKKFRIRRDQLQAKSLPEFPIMDDLLKDLATGQDLLGLILFYDGEHINIEDIHLGNSNTAIDRIHNLDLFRSLCSQHLCSTVLALQVEDFLYASPLLKPNIIAFLSELFWKCETQRTEEEERFSIPPARSKTSLSDVRSNDALNKITSVIDESRSKSVPVNKEMDKYEDYVKNNVHENSGKFLDKENVPTSQLPSDNLISKPPTPRKITPRLDNIVPKKSSEPEKQVTGKRDRTLDMKHEEPKKKSESRNHSAPDILGGLPQSPLLARRAKQKQQRLLALEDWDMQDDTEELKFDDFDIPRSYSLSSGLDRSQSDLRQSFHAWQSPDEFKPDTSGTRNSNQRISLDFKNDQAQRIAQKPVEKVKANKTPNSTMSSDLRRMALSLSGSGKYGFLTAHEDGHPHPDASDNESDLELNEFEEMEALVMNKYYDQDEGSQFKSISNVMAHHGRPETDDINSSSDSEDMDKFKLEVLQKLTADRLSSLPEYQEIEEEPMFYGENNLPEQQEHVDMNGITGQEDDDDMYDMNLLSPIAEQSEPGSSAATSHTHTPSDLLSPTSEGEQIFANDALMAQSGRMSPSSSKTPRLQSQRLERSLHASLQSAEALARCRGSYTIDTGSVEAAKAAGIPVIDRSYSNLRNSAFVARTNENVLDELREETMNEALDKITPESEATSDFSDVAFRTASTSPSESVASSGIAVNGHNDIRSSSSTPQDEKANSAFTDQYSSTYSRTHDHGRTHDHQDGPHSRTSSEDVIIYESKNFQKRKDNPESNLNTFRKKGSAFDFNSQTIHQYQQDSTTYPKRKSCSETVNQHDKNSEEKTNLINEKKPVAFTFDLNTEVVQELTSPRSTSSRENSPRSHPEEVVDNTPSHVDAATMTIKHRRGSHDKDRSKVDTRTMTRSKGAPQSWESWEDRGQKVTTSWAGLADVPSSQSESAEDDSTEYLDNSKDSGNMGSPRISWLTAAGHGLGGQVLLNEKGQIDEVANENDVTPSPQMALLRMQLEEKRRHIEAEKRRTRVQHDEERRRLGETAFWYVLGKARSTGNSPELIAQEDIDKVHDPTPEVQKHQGSAPQRTASPRQTSRSCTPTPPPESDMGHIQETFTPPVEQSTPSASPHIIPDRTKTPSPTPKGAFVYEYRLSEAPAARASSPDVTRISQVSTLSGMSTQPPASALETSPSPLRKCWDTSATPPPPLARKSVGATMAEQVDMTSVGGEIMSVGGDMTSFVSSEGGEMTPAKKPMSMYIVTDEANQLDSSGLTPDQAKKKERFMRMRQKRQEDEKLKKEAEMEKKRRKEERVREQEYIKKREDEERFQALERERADRQRDRINQEELSRQSSARSTFRVGPGQVRPSPNITHPTMPNDPAIEQEPSQSAFNEFSGPQCYVKPSGKSNRKIIINAIQYVCLSGTVNKDSKDKCLQVITDSDAQHFLVLFRDGLKFRGLYSYNPENDQVSKLFGIGPRTVTPKMIESLYKYNSGGKDFIKIPSKSLSISVDGFNIQKSFWESRKTSVQSKTASNLKRPPKPPQR